MEGETLGDMEEIVGRGDPTRHGRDHWKGRPKETWRRSSEGETLGDMEEIVGRGDPRRHGEDRWKGRP